MADCLLLNADAQPVSFLPLSTLTWQDAIKYLVLEKASVLEWHDNWIVRSASWETAVPAVMMLSTYLKPKQYVRFSKGNVFLRDDWICQYCESDLTPKTATMDHVLPVSKGGKTMFENIVAACPLCNANKGNNHKIVPKKKPYKPDYWELVNKRKKFPFSVRHNSWNNYLEIQ
jgi:5-methylcytosine-specific restriction endonuclease McrA